MNDLFYRHFEQLFRGSRVEIKQRLRVYLPFLTPMPGLYPDALALDLGCGRGEWLELLRDQGLRGLGVDLDDGMLEDCRALSLDVETQDAILKLQSLPDSSVSIVSAFHLVEHIRFDDLRTLVSEAHRVLKPGGILIMETPNPENLTVASSSFHLDPTHTQPIPPGLLSFIPQYYGFARHVVLRLQESAALSDNLSPSLLNVLEGVSPDYAVIAQKSADEHILTQFDTAFSLNLGLTINTLSERYDDATKRSISHLLQVADNNREGIQALQSQMDWLKSQLAESADNNREGIQALQSQIDWLKSEIDSIYNSRSWKLTRPLRALGNGMRRLKRFFLR